MPYLPIERLIRQSRFAPDLDQPFALVEKVANVRQVSALNDLARKAGLQAGMPVADAQNLCPTLQTMAHNKKADARFLENLGLWGLQFSPLVMPLSPDGLAFNISGCDHLFGGEQMMAEQCRTQYAAQGLTTRLAVADTVQAARAVARYGKGALSIIDTGRLPHERALGPLPLYALAPDQKTYRALQAVGLRKVADLKRVSRAALARRYSDALQTAYDQALGYQAEPFTPLLPPAIYRQSRNLVNPLTSFPHLCDVAGRLSVPLAKQLEENGLGAQQLRLIFFRVDGEAVWFDVRLGTCSHDAAHFTRLLHDRLRQFEDRIDAGFGFERAILEAVETTPFDHQQQVMAQEKQQATSNVDQAVVALADRLRARFGDQSIQQFYARASHWPERSCRMGAYEAQAQAWDNHTKMRPLSLFNPPHLIDVVADSADTAPVRFVWRHQVFDIVHAEGPERIAPEWWLLPEAVRKAGPEVQRRFRSRDYYRVEDKDGHRFWLFCRGTDGAVVGSADSLQPQWFLHGLFG